MNDELNKFFEHNQLLIPSQMHLLWKINMSEAFYGMRNSPVYMNYFMCCYIHDSVKTEITIQSFYHSQRLIEYYWKPRLNSDWWNGNSKFLDFAKVSDPDRTTLAIKVDQNDNGSIWLELPDRDLQEDESIFRIRIFDCLNDLLLNCKEFYDDNSDFNYNLTRKCGDSCWTRG